jgi:hypothetical protein
MCLIRSPATSNANTVTRSPDEAAAVGDHCGVGVEQADGGLQR